jgi:non-specific serine/threonine protein kinase
VGGVGKTRLAVRVAVGAAATFADRVWFVDLAPIADADVIIQTVAQTVGIREAAGSPILTSVITNLRAQKTLLVLDNCEHLVHAIGQLSWTLLQECPQLTILATSREALRCDGEVVSLIQPLNVTQSSTNMVDALRSEAVQLFVDRAASAEYHFDDASVADAVAICQRLDGLPLALELAAGMLRAVGPGELALRLDQSLRVLTSGTRAGLARHASLHAAIDWSYQLLTQTERRIFERLAVFVGGASLEAAEAVCAADDTSAVDVLSTLAALVEKSLVVAERTSDGSVRYRQLVTLREYAHARLVEHHEHRPAQERHATYFAQLASATTPGVREFHTSLLERVAPDHDNLRAALAFLKESRDERQLTLASDLWFFWFVRGHYREGAAWLEDALNMNPSMAPSARMAAQCALANMILWSGELERVVALCEDSLRIARALGNQWYAGLALQDLSMAAMLRGDNAAAVPLSDESVAAARATGDRWLLVVTLHILANALERTGDMLGAEARYAEALQLGRDANDDWMSAYPLANLKTLVARQGQVEPAEAMAREALMLAWRIGDRRLCAAILLHLAAFAFNLRRPRRAARLLGASEAEYLRLDAFPEVPPDNVDEVRSALSLGDLAVARGKGRLLDLETAVRDVLADNPRERASGRMQRNGPLTPRELEIANLVAQGLSNLQIAERLVITEGTTQNHLSHILDKLGATSRLQVAAWVFAHDARQHDYAVGESETGAQPRFAN